MEQPKLVLIKERYDLKPVKSEGNVVYLRAPVAVFGKKNNNNRIYEEENYLPLLEELQEKIEGNNLTGELDHPGERLEVYLSNVSHKIEELTYNKEQRIVEAKIRLIEGTTAGDNAIALHNAGVTLGISSRAIGIIKENKALLKKIITFDCVSTPGFKNAILKPVNESVSYDTDAEECAIFEITDEKYLQKYSYLLEDDSDNNINDNNMDSKEILEQLKNMKESIEGIKGNITDLNGRFDSLADYNQEHVNELNEFASTILKSKEDLEKKVEEKGSVSEEFLSYNEKETEKLKNLKEDVETIEETMDMFITMMEKYSEAQSDKLNKFVDQDHENWQKVEEFVNHQHGETEKLNQLVKYLDNQSKKLNRMVEHDTEESDKLNHLVTWANKNFKELYERAEFKDVINKQKSIKFDITKVTESVDNILDNVRKQKTFKDAVVNKYPFLQKLDEGKQQEFLSLDDSRKTMITKTIEEKSCETAEEIISEWDTAISNINNSKAIWLANAGKDYQLVWESLDADRKTKVVRLAEMRNFKTQDDVDNFWKGLKLTKELEVIKENEITEDDFDIQKAVNEASQISEDYKLGYSKDYIQKVRETIKRNK